MDDESSFDVMSVPKDWEHGYILEVGLNYPIETHDYYNDLPFCVEA